MMMRGGMERRDQQTDGERKSRQRSRAGEERADHRTDLAGANHGITLAFPMLTASCDLCAIKF